VWCGPQKQLAQGVLHVLPAVGKTSAGPCSTQQLLVYVLPTDAATRVTRSLLLNLKQKTTANSAHAFLLTLVAPR
jgi:hypothetical protein